METITINFETTVEYTIDIEISEEDFKLYNNGEIDSDDLIEKYEDEIRREQTKIDYNELESSSYLWIERKFKLFMD